MDAMEQVCFGRAATFGGMFPGKNIMQYTDDLVIQSLVAISPSKNGTILRCHWHNEQELCYDHFHRLLTDEGVCYTFNAFNSRDLYTE